MAEVEKQKAQNIIERQKKMQEYHEKKQTNETERIVQIESKLNKKY